MNVTGADGLAAKLATAAAGAKAGARRGLYLAAQNTLNESNRHVPFEEGDLERDGGVSIDEAGLKAAVSYGRSASTAPYAVPQHERLDYHHDAGRNAKFLENAMNSTAAQNAQIIAQAIKSGMGT